MEISSVIHFPPVSCKCTDYSVVLSVGQGSTPTEHLNSTDRNKRVHSAAVQSGKMCLKCVRLETILGGEHEDSQVL